jgi:glutamate synthase domain-containing protein 2
MAMELESTIMAEIGLGNHYTYYNGSETCAYTRKVAAEKLSKAIENHHKKDKNSIAKPDENLVGLVKEVAECGDEHSYDLTKTWVVASYVIAEHIHQAKSTDKERRENYDRVEQFIRKKYLPSTNFDGKPTSRSNKLPPTSYHLD